MSPYAAEENNGNEDIHINIHDSNAVCEFLVVQVTKWDNKSFGDGDNLFVQGMDSLQALQFVRYLRKALKKPGLAITILYTNPSLVQLAGSIAENSDREVDSQATEAIERGKKIEETIQRYCQLVDEIATEQKLATDPPAVSDHVVILTGSSGSLGSHILETLIQNTSVSHIYCLNRTSSSASSPRSPHLQNNQKENRLNSSDFPTSKITFLTATLSKPDLGLDSEIFAKLQNLATDFIHSAWPVNFNVSLETFKPQLDGIVNILSFVSVIPRRVSLLFVSSISSISALSSPTTVPEKMVDSVSAPLSMGYAESKFISEHMLNHAAKKFPTIDIKVARVGQIAGPAHTDGIWKMGEWLPSLVVTSFHMGFIPENLGRDMIMLDWVPVDILSSSLIDIAFDSDSTTIEPGARVFHPLNPAPTTGETLLPSILKTLLASSHGIASRPAVTPIPYTAWLQKLRDTAKEDPLSSELDDVLVKYPAIKLLDFFEKLPETRWMEKDVDTAIGVSEGLRGLKGIEGVWMEKWVGGWI